MYASLFSKYKTWHKICSTLLLLLCTLIQEVPCLCHQKICRYLVATKNKGFVFNVNTKNLKINCYVDADFTGLHSHEDNMDPIVSKSRTGYVITLGDSLISWSSRLQTETALFTTEADILALSASMREIIWVRRLISEISESFGIPIDSVTDINAIVHEDNHAAISKCIKMHYQLQNITHSHQILALKRTFWWKTWNHHTVHQVWREHRIYMYKRNKNRLVCSLV